MVYLLLALMLFMVWRAYSYFRAKRTTAAALSALAAVFLVFAAYANYAMFSADPAEMTAQQETADAGPPRAQSTMDPLPPPSSAPPTSAEALDDFYGAEEDGDFEEVFVEDQRSENRRLQDQY